jgi:hypothetical protein
MSRDGSFVGRINMKTAESAVVSQYAADKVGNALRLELDRRFVEGHDRMKLPSNSEMERNGVRELFPRTT